VVNGRSLVGYVAAFLAGAGVLYGVLLTGSPWPPVRVDPQGYQRQVVRVGFSSVEARLNPLLQEGWEVERVDRLDLDSAAYVLRRRRP
jgi:hypothetical protein